MPPMMRKRGRPKGTNDTVIGVPAKKRATKCGSKPKVIPFLRLHVSLKEKGSYSYLSSVYLLVNL